MLSTYDSERLRKESCKWAFANDPNLRYGGGIPVQEGVDMSVVGSTCPRWSPKPDASAYFIQAGGVPFVACLKSPDSAHRDIDLSEAFVDLGRSQMEV